MQTIQACPNVNVFHRSILWFIYSIFLFLRLSDPFLYHNIQLIKKIRHLISFDLVPVSDQQPSEDVKLNVLKLQSQIHEKYGVYKNRC